MDQKKILSQLIKYKTTRNELIQFEQHIVTLEQELLNIEKVLSDEILKHHTATNTGDLRTLHTVKVHSYIVDYYYYSDDKTIEIKTIKND